MDYKFYDKHNEKIHEAYNEDEDSEEGLLNALDEVAEEILYEDNPAGVSEVYYKDMINDIKRDLVYVPEHIEKVKKEIKDFLTRNVYNVDTLDRDILNNYLTWLDEKDCSDETLIDVFSDYEEYILE